MSDTKEKHASPKPKAKLAFAINRHPEISAKKSTTATPDPSASQRMIILNLVERLDAISKVTGKSPTEILAEAIKFSNQAPVSNQLVSEPVVKGGRVVGSSLSGRAVLRPVARDADRKLPSANSEVKLPVHFKSSLAAYSDTQLTIIEFESNYTGYDARKFIYSEKQLFDMPRDVDGPKVLIVPKEALAIIGPLLDKNAIKYKLRNLFNTDKLSNEMMMELRGYMRGLA